MRVVRDAAPPRMLAVRGRVLDVRVQGATLGVTAAGDGWATLAAIVIVGVPLMLVMGTVSGWLRRRLVVAAEEAARRLGGTYAPGGRFSGGTITARDVVIEFQYGHSSRPARTTAIARVKPRTDPLLWRRSILGRWPDAAAPFAARLDALGVVELHAAIGTLSLRASGIVRDADRLVRLAEGAVALAAELDRA